MQFDATPSPVIMLSEHSLLVPLIVADSCAIYSSEISELTIRLDHVAIVETMSSCAYAVSRIRFAAFSRNKFVKDNRIYISIILAASLVHFSPLWISHIFLLLFRWR